MKKITFTFNDLKDWNACSDGYKTLSKNLGGAKSYGRNTPITLIQGLDSNGVEDCLWAAQKFIDRNPGHPIERDLRLFACDCAERVLPIFEKHYPEDDRPRNAIEVSRQYANCEVDDAARAAARDAARAAAGDDARAAAGAAARAAAWAAASDAAWAAAWAAASDAAWAAASDAEKQWQDKKLREILVVYS